MVPISASFTFMQNNDSCDDEKDGQYLRVSVEDGGGGCYAVISTARWATDGGKDLDELVETIRKCINQCRSPWDE